MKLVVTLELTVDEEAMADRGISQEEIGQFAADSVELASLEPARPEAESEQFSMKDILVGSPVLALVCRSKQPAASAPDRQDIVAP